MLTLYEVTMAMPAYLFVYAGFRTLFGHDVGLAITLVAAAFVAICTTLVPIFSKSTEEKQLKERRAE